MEPLLSSAAVNGVRAGLQASQPELSAILRDGRLVAAEVLRSPGDGTVLLAVGRHQVPAQTNIYLSPGDSFLFRVHVEGAEIVLQTVGAESGEQPSLLAALRGVISEDRPIGELLQSVAVRVRAALAPGAEALDGLRTLLQGLEQSVFRPGGGEGELARALLFSGLRYEAALFAAMQSGRFVGELRRLGSDLKARLLAALRDLPEGSVREAVAQALLGLEAEQLLNAARHRSGEPGVWSFPVLDGSSWTTARLILPAGDSDGRREGSETDEGARLVLGVSFQNTGPVRAEVVLAPHRLSVRFLVANADVADRLWRDFPQLSERLALGDRQVHLFAKIGTPEQVAVPAERMDVGFLEDHRLMDVSG